MLSVNHTILYYFFPIWYISDLNGTWAGLPDGIQPAWRKDIIEMAKKCNFQWTDQKNKIRIYSLYTSM
jgi:hypothetical protein